MSFAKDQNVSSTSLLPLLLFAALLSAGCRGEASPGEALSPLPEPDSASARLFEQTMAFARKNNLHERPIGEVMQAVGTRFRGTPYIEFPLDQRSKETLVCRLDGFDCFTFDEAMLAMARAIKAQKYTWDAYARATRAQRYRRGRMNGYCSRLHYYSAWIHDNQQRGVVRNITERLGGKRLSGERLQKDFSFMTDNRGSYKRIASNDSLYQCIQNVEQRLDSMLQVYYIPQDSLRPVYDEMKAGDLIATATDIEGLDVTHTGMIYKGEGDTTGLLHASLDGGVKISPDLQAYVQGVDAQIGVIVARPQPAPIPGSDSASAEGGS